MTIQNPVGGSPEDPYEKYKKYDVEGVSHENPEKKKKKFGDEPPKKPLPPGSFFLILLHKILDYFISLGSRSKRKIGIDLYELKEAFEAMKEEDKSQDVQFLNHLSTIWHHTLEHSLLFKRTDPFSEAFRIFLKKIQNYPEGQDHTLGYYLTEHTKGQWLPFPYMELIQELHEEHQRNPEESKLTLWTRELIELGSSE